MTLPVLGPVLILVAFLIKRKRPVYNVVHSRLIQINIVIYWLEITVKPWGEDLRNRPEKFLFTTRAKGIGLGMVITKTFVERYGGSIEVQSQVGKGSTFNINLPIRKK